MVPKALGKKLSAGDWVKEVSKIVDGKGGGRPDIAQSYGADPSRVPEALKFALEFALSKLQ
jgi:alanyl-tRNA synthetase